MIRYACLAGGGRLERTLCEISERRVREGDVDGDSQTGGRHGGCDSRCKARRRRLRGGRGQRPRRWPPTAASSCPSPPPTRPTPAPPFLQPSFSHAHSEWKKLTNLLDAHSRRLDVEAVHCAYKSSHSRHLSPLDGVRRVTDGGSDGGGGDEGRGDGVAAGASVTARGTSDLSVGGGEEGWMTCNCRQRDSNERLMEWPY